MQISNVSTLCTQSTRLYQWKLLNSLHMHYLAPFRITKGSNSTELAPNPKFSILKEHLVDIRVLKKFDEFQLLHFQDIKE